MRAPGRNAARDTVWLSDDDCRIADFLTLLEQQTDPADCPHADSMVHEVLIYDCDRLSTRIGSGTDRREVQAEFSRALLNGPGLVLFQHAFPDLAVLDRATEAFDTMIAEQRHGSSTAG